MLKYRSCLVSQGRWWLLSNSLLPPAFRRNGEGNVFIGVCPFTPTGGGGSTPSKVWTVGCTPSCWWGGGPIPGLDGEVPHPRSRWGVPILLIRGVPHPRSGQGVPHPADGGGFPIPGLDRGYPILLMGGGYPIPGLDGGVPHPRLGLGVPILLMGGTPSQVWTGGSHPRSGWGTSLSRTGCGTPWPRLDGVISPPPQSKTGWGRRRPPVSKASTCYATGGVPLALTQEDFLVYDEFSKGDLYFECFA